MKLSPMIFVASILVLTMGCNAKATSTGQTAEEANEAEATALRAEILPHDFSVVIEGDTVYFTRHAGGKSVALTYWSRANFDNHIITVPAVVEYDGKSYDVTEIGDEAMGVEFYGDREGLSIWFTDKHGVERIVLPMSITKIGKSAFTSRFSQEIEVQLPQSVEYLGDNAVWCSAMRDKNNAIVLPPKVRRVGYLLDVEDHEEDGGENFRYSRLYIPEHLEYITGLDNFYRNQPLFHEVVVDPRNKHYKTINGTLYSYDLDSIYMATVQNPIYIPKSLKIDESMIASLNEGWYPQLRMPRLISIVTEDGNPYCVAIDDMLYDINGKSLIMVGGSENNVAHVPAWCETVAILDWYAINWPIHFVLADEMSDKQVKKFVEEIMAHVIGDNSLTFTHKGRTWTESGE